MTTNSNDIEKMFNPLQSAEWVDISTGKTILVDIKTSYGIMNIESFSFSFNMSDEVHDFIKANIKYGTPIYYSQHE